ncbi:hypothetical protein ACFXPY_38190 [Streptomyces sp. NPDC059153]|uniref:hypothetical protein n=1 Tax=Streptomyces sp. NPDC059153 TaxID=3346743 RepID=UPI0036AB1918
MSEVGTLQENVLLPQGLHFSGLAPRETDVLRLIAEGHDTDTRSRRSVWQRTRTWGTSTVLTLSSSEASPHPVLNGPVGALPHNWQHRMGRVAEQRHQLS